MIMSILSIVPFYNQLESTTINLRRELHKEDDAKVETKNSNCHKRITKKKFQDTFLKKREDMVRLFKQKNTMNQFLSVTLEKL